MNTEEFIERAKQIHGDKYDYSLSIYNRRGKIKIICPEHGVLSKLPETIIEALVVQNVEKATEKELRENS